MLTVKLVVIAGMSALKANTDYVVLVRRHDGPRKILHNSIALLSACMVLHLTRHQLARITSLLRK